MIVITYFPRLYCPQAVLVSQTCSSCQGHAELRDCRASPDLHATYTTFIKQVLQDIEAFEGNVIFLVA